MVDAIVSFTVKKLANALTGETLFLLGVGTQVGELHDDLRRMQCFLKDADAKQQQGDERVRNWVADIRNVAYDVEDLVDTFILKFDAVPKSGGVQNFINRTALIVKNFKHLSRVGKKIEAIQSRLKLISNSRVTYGINGLRDNEASSSRKTQKMQQQLRNQYPHVDDDDIIGLEEYTKTLLTELVKDDERRCVISLVGVGGLGKTTLAKKLYKHDTVLSRFDCRAWSSISQQLNTRDVLLEIMKKSMNPNDDELIKIKELNEGDLVEKLYNSLQDKRYFIVVDDLWSFNDWTALSPAFPNGKRGSKLLLTTRNKEVALQVDPWSLQLELKLLNDEDSWELLCKKTFPKNMGDSNFYPTGLKKLGTEMVRKCGGLPLAICVLGGILATKREEIKEWEFVNKDIISNINKGKTRGLFPEDYAIPRKKLIQLWIAEGFISQTKENALVTLEDIGKHHYYAELIQRCMIQADSDTSPWQGKTFRMHDLMRDLCLLKAKEIHFLDIYNHRIDGITLNSSSTDTCRRLRRYAVYHNDQHDRYDSFYFNNSACVLRTLLVEMSLGNSLAPLRYDHLKLLRVLDLENVSVFSTDITKEVGKLIHLRYLALGIFDIPISSSIGNLRNLRTLRLNSSRGSLLPGTITNLVQLGHLEIGSGEVGENFQIESFINLQTLKYIEAGKWIRKDCFGKLSKLRNLGVFNISQAQTDVLMHEIVSKKSSSSSDNEYENPLRVLSITSNENINSKIFDSLSCCHNLHRLQLNGRMDILNLQTYPPNLTKLVMCDSKLQKDPMETLQYLPNLTILTMREAYTGAEMVCSTNGFPQLQVLQIRLFTWLQKWTIDQGGMPHLKELRLSFLRKLSMIPEGLVFITALKKLKIDGMPRMGVRVKREVGEDWYKVQHIPLVLVADFL